MELHLGWRGAWLVVASFLAGALNAMAGGGSFLSFPALLGAGVLPVQANATNTVALWPGQAASIAGYFAEIRDHAALVLPVCSAALVGGLAGAILLLRTGQATFMAMVPWLLLFAAMLFAASVPASRWLQRKAAGQPGSDDPGSNHPRSGAALKPLLAAVAAVCLYIGYFGAGGGFLLMSVLTLFGIENINRVNALKVIVTTTANGVAVLTFIVGKKIEWRYCLLMMVTAALGGFLGAHLSRRLNPTLLRVGVVLIGLGMSAYFFYIQ